MEMRAGVTSRVCGPPHRFQQCAFGMRADDVLLAGHVPPLAGDSRGARELVEHSRFDTGVFASRGIPFFDEHDQRTSGNQRRVGGNRFRYLWRSSGERRVDRPTPNEADARVGPMHRDRIASDIERKGDATGWACLGRAGVENRD